MNKSEIGLYYFWNRDNLLAIGVSQNSQRNGVATEMMSYIEQQLKLKRRKNTHSRNIK
jgi:hypothetical protein